MTQPQQATYEELRAAYDLKVQELAAETLRTSRLINAIHDANHNAWDPPMDPWCHLCRVLRELRIPDRPDRRPVGGVSNDH